MTRISIDQLVDPLEATVVYTREGGHITEAHLDLGALPRLDSMMVGKAVTEVPDVVKRLCGICPITHHLAGVRALDALANVTIPPTAQAVRALLQEGSVLDTVAIKVPDRSLAVRLRRFGKVVQQAAGCMGHFPDVAIPGGVRAPADASRVGKIREELPELLAAAQTLPAADSNFDGANVILIDAAGNPDPLGSLVRVTGSLTTTFPVSEWLDHVKEQIPGSAAPRPLIDAHPYRVGPHAWGGNQIARCLQHIAQLIELPELVVGETSVPAEIHAGTGIGAVDGPRGILIHAYTADERGVVKECTILTPTAQNEPWLSEMLTQAVREGGVAEGGVAKEGAAEKAVAEVAQSIRTADPCLPCSSAPEGAMGVVLSEASPHSGTTH